MKIYIRVQTAEQLKAAKEWGGADAILVPAELGGQCPGNHNPAGQNIAGQNIASQNPGGQCLGEPNNNSQNIAGQYIDLPAILRENRGEVSALTDAPGVVLKNLDQLGLYNAAGYKGNVIGDPFLYTYNPAAMKTYLEIFPDMEFIATDELTDRELAELMAAIEALGCSAANPDSTGNVSAGPDRCEEHQRAVNVSPCRDRFIYKAYGYQPLMFTAQCFGKNYAECGRQQFRLTDEKNESFISVSSCRDCLNTIYNGMPTFMLDRLDEIKKMGISKLLMDFTVESAVKAGDILRLLDQALAGENVTLPERFTRGHHKKGID